MKFEKWHGLGNDFIIINTDKIDKNINFDDCASLMCDRHFGIGADSIILIGKIDENNFTMKIYTADGGTTEMCGNGIRCAAKYIYEQQLTTKSKFNVITEKRTLVPDLLDNGDVLVDMGEPIINDAHLTLQGFNGSDISMGNPHFAAIVEDLLLINVKESGKSLELDPHFPNRSNIEFFQVLDRQNIRMKVWERGCGITLACGTGSCASTVTGILHGLLDRKVQVHLDGGKLQVEWDEKSNHVYMSGTCTKVFEGEYLI